MHPGSMSSNGPIYSLHPDVSCPFSLIPNYQLAAVSTCGQWGTPTFQYDWTWEAPTCCGKVSCYSLCFAIIAMKVGAMLSPHRNNALGFILSMRCELIQKFSGRTTYSSLTPSQPR